MNKIKEFFRDWSIFEKVWLVFVCSLMTVIWFINGDTPFMLVLSLTGSLNLVLGAKGKVAGLYFAIINSVPVSGNPAVRRGNVQCSLQHSGQRRGHLSVE